MKKRFWAGAASFLALCLGSGCTEFAAGTVQSAGSPATDSPTNLPMMERVAGQDVGLSLDGLSEGVSEFNGALSVRVPLYRVGEHTGYAQYQSESYEFTQTLVDEGGDVAVSDPRLPSAGMPYQWHRPWFARWRVERNPSSQRRHRQQGATIEFANGSTERVLSGQLPQISDFNGAGTQFRFTTGFSRWSQITEPGVFPVHMRLTTRDGTNYTFDRGNCMQPSGSDADAFCEPTLIQDVHGNGIRIEYYGTSDTNPANDTFVPRVVEAFRTNASGARVPTARAYFYLEGFADTSGALAVPSDVTQAGSNPLVSMIAYPGPASSRLDIDATWHRTVLSYADSAVVLPDQLTTFGLLGGWVNGSEKPFPSQRRNLVEIRTEGRGYRFNYGGGVYENNVQVSGTRMDGRMTSLRTWDGTRIDYTWGRTRMTSVIDSLDFFPHVARRVLTVPGGEQSTWDFAHTNVVRNGLRLHASATNFPTASARVAFFHPTAPYGSPLSAKTGLIAEALTYLSALPAAVLTNDHATWADETDYTALSTWMAGREPVTRASYGYAVNALGTTLLTTPTNFNFQYVHLACVPFNGCFWSVQEGTDSYRDFPGWVASPAFDVSSRSSTPSEGYPYCASGQINSGSVTCAGVAAPTSPCMSGDGVFASLAACEAASSTVDCYSASLGSVSGFCGSFDGPAQGSSCPTGTVPVASCGQGPAVVQGQSIVRIYRDNRPSDYVLERFSNNGRGDYDIYGNAPFVRTFSTSDPVVVNRTESSCPAHCQRTADDGWSCGSGLSVCRQDTIEATWPTTNANVGSETRREYWIESSSNEIYESANLTGLVRTTRQCALGSQCTENNGLLGRTDMYYDNRELDYPFQSGVPGDLSKAPRGRLTAIRSQLIGATESPTTFYNYYGLSPSADEPAGALAETASLVSAGSYRRVRQSFASSAGPATTPTQTFTITDANAVSSLGFASYNTWGQLVSSTDENGAITRRCYDDLGRVTAVFSPTDNFGSCASVSGASTSITYSQNAEPYSPYLRNVSIRSNVTYQGQQTALQSARFFDGLGRTIEDRALRHMASGGYLIQRSTRYWAHTSQPVLVTEPYQVMTTALDVLSGVSLAGARTETQYDSIGRALESRQVRGDNSVASRSRSEHYLNAAGLAWNETRSIDPQGQVSISRLDGLLRPTQQVLADGSVTSRQYDALGRVTSVTSPDGAASNVVLDSLGRTLSQTTPEGGTVSYTYDLAGQLLTIRRPNGTQVRMTYDARGRLLARARRAGPTWIDEARYAYDAYPPDSPFTGLPNALGRVTRVWFEEGHIDYRYDLRGRVIEQRTYYPELGVKTLIQNYDSVGTVRSVAYQQGQVDELTYAVDLDENLDIASVTAGQTVAANIERDALGRMVRRTLMPGAPIGTDDFSYDGFGRLVGFNNPDQLAGDTFAYRLRYDDPQHGSAPRFDGLPSEVEWRRVGTTEAAYGYTYDARGQVVEADFHEQTGATWNNVQPFDLQASYNSSGGFTTLTRANAQGQDTTVSFTYNTRRQLTQTSGQIAAQFVYDGAGNLRENTQFGQNSLLTYTSSERPRAIATGTRRLEFGYDGSQAQIRIERQSYVTPCTVAQDPQAGDPSSGRVGGRGPGRGDGDPPGNLDPVPSGCYVRDAAVYLVRDPSGTPIAEYDGNTIRRLFLPGIGFVVPAAAGNANVPAGIHFEMTDHLGSVRATVHQSGALTSGMDYDPFGEIIDARSASSVAGDQRFAGMRGDDSLGLDLLVAGARVFHPGLGRFLSRDPLATLDSVNSAYVYAANAPSSNTDPSGLCTNCPMQGPVIPFYPGTDRLDYGGAYYTATLPEITITPAPTIWTAPQPSALQQAGAFIAGVGVGYATGWVANVALTALLGSNPIGWAIVGVAALAYTAYTVHQNWDGIVAGADRIVSGQGTASDFFTIGTFAGGISAQHGRAAQTKVGNQIRGMFSSANEFSAQSVSVVDNIIATLGQPRASMPLPRGSASMSELAQASEALNSELAIVRINGQRMLYRGDGPSQAWFPANGSLIAHTHPGGVMGLRASEADFGALLAMDSPQFSSTIITTAGYRRFFIFDGMSPSVYPFP